MKYACALLTVLILTCAATLTAQDATKPEPAAPKAETPKAEAKPAQWDGEVKTDLKNETDPTDDAKIEKADAFTAVWYGFKAHFNSEAGLKKFKVRPYAFSAKLSLEMDKDGVPSKVDASTFVDTPVIPEYCPVMGSEITKEDDVYILHRGYKFYFCCWGGCWKKFLANPAKYYDSYGLVEKDGKLVPKEEKKEEDKGDKKDDGAKDDSKDK